MTTSLSPVHVLKAQADRTAAILKAAERGERVAGDAGGKIAAARARDTVTFAVVMDDKIIKIEMAWTTIRDTSEAGIAEFILNQMRDARDKVH